MRPLLRRLFKCLFQSTPSGPPGPDVTAINWDQLTGVSNSSGTLRKTAGTGSFTNAVAYASSQIPAGDFHVYWTLAPTAYDGGVIGVKLSGTPSTGGGYTQYDFAFNLNDFNQYGAGSSQVFPLGVSALAFNSVPGDVIGIRRVGTVLTYEQNGVVLVTNPSAATTAGYLGTNPYTNSGKDFLTGATLEVPA